MLSFLKSKLFKEKVLCYTFFVVLLKFIFFIGFILDKTHLTIDLFAALKKVYPGLLFQSSFIIIFLSFALLFKNRARLWYLIALNFFISLLLLVDLWYYRGFNSMPTMHALQETTNLNNLSGSVVSFIHLIDFIFIIDVIILIVIAVFKKNICRKMERSILAFTILLVFSLSALLYVPIKVNVFKIHDPSIYFFQQYDPDITVRNLSPLGYHMTDIYSFWQDRKPYNLTSAEEVQIQQWFDDKKENLPDNKYKALFKGKNLIFIQVESMEKFFLNQKVFGQEVTPNLNRMLKNSLYFSNISEQVNSGQSSDGDLMANTSVYPIRKGSTFFRYPYNTYTNSLPKLMENIGYSTLAIHPDKGSYWNWMPALKSIGFQTCIDSTHFNMNQIIGMGLSDGSFLEQVETILAKQKQPFYSFMVTLSSHAPFDLPQEYCELKLNDNLNGTTLGGYFQSMRYVDTQIGNFIGSLQKDGLLDNSVIVIYGDHGGVHKFYPGDVQKVKNPENWWLENKGIPFIIYQNKVQGEEIKTLGGQVDFMPTVAYLMGIDEKNYENSAMGRNLLKTNRNFVLLRGRIYRYGSGSENYKENAIKGFDIADMIIKGNYFKNEK